MKYFLRWVLIFCLICVGLFFMYINNLFYIINKCDFTKISFLIMVIFLIYTIIIGKDTYRFNKSIHKNLSTCNFIADKFLTLGMIGTVIGFIYMLNTCFTNIDVSNIAVTQKILSKMSTGMATALYTTATGLICSVLIKIQIFNLEQKIKDQEN